MKSLFAGLICLSFTTYNQWQPDFQTARKIAKEKHQYILLNFSGSDWCIPCIRMHKEIFDNRSFQQMADTTLVMYDADFPRNKKNALSKELKKQNEELADKYDPDGKFPLTLLLDADGKIIRSWEGFPDQTPEQFTQLVKQLCDDNRN
jgi:thioredoxin-related protein